MTEIERLHEKLDKLPDLIVGRLDDRYLKKDGSDKIFITRREGGAVSVVLSIMVTVIAIWTGVTSYFKQ